MRAADGNLRRKAEKASPAISRRLALAIGLVILLAAAGAAAIYGQVGPTRMDPQSTMNVAVTEIGMLDAQGQMQSSPDGALVGLIAGALNSANRQIDAGGRVTVWHDGLPAGAETGQARCAVRQDARGAGAGSRGAGAADRRRCSDLWTPWAEGRRDAARRRNLRDPAAAPRGQRDPGRYQLGEPILVAANLAQADSLAKEAVAVQVTTGPSRSSGCCWGCVRMCSGVTSRPWRSSGTSKPTCHCGAAVLRARKSSPTYRAGGVLPQALR